MEKSWRDYSAKEIHAISEKVQNFAERPIIIEVTGTPNAGKSPAITLLSRLLRRFNFKIKTIYESASRCRLPEKYSPEFDCWTACETIRQILENLYSQHNLIICERGLFDAICWANLYYLDGSLTEQDLKDYSAFYLNHRWKSQLKLVYLFKCDPEEAIRREGLEGDEYQGVIVNKQVLTKINDAMGRAYNLHQKDFGTIIELDTTKLSQTEISRKFVSDILQFLDNYFAPI